MGRISRFIPQAAFVAASASLLFTTTACNEYPVALVDSTGALEESIDIQGGDTPKLDLLWVIDNSGSMCRSQSVLREGIRDFVDTLGTIDLDFHIAVTTTHLKFDSANEPVSIPGHLQSTPQPLPGFTAACRHAVDEFAEPIRSDFTPVLENIEVAVSCTTDPDAWSELLSPSQRRLECATDPGHFNCDAGEVVPLEDLFPPTAAYRDIPKVIRSSDPRYSDESGALRLGNLEADFACMSLVGTRGHGFERGLGALNLAVHPDLTGGPGAEEGVAPNSGFIRENSQTGVIFVTDENDCTDDGTLNEGTTCDVDECTIQEQLGPNGALVSVTDLRNEFLINLAMSKGTIGLNSDETPARVKEMLQDDIITASFHGRHRIFDFSNEGDSKPACTADTDCGGSEMCVFPVPWEEEGECISENPVDTCSPELDITASCITSQGIAKSGHRYAEFISDFPVFFPDPRDAANPSGEFEISNIDGLICDNFAGPLQELANLFLSESGGCISDIYQCSGPADESCPASAATGEPGTCTRYPGFNDDSGATYFCDSGIELRLSLPEGEDDLQLLETTGFCVEGTTNTRQFPNSCVISPEQYSWGECEARPDALTIAWENNAWFQILGGLNVSARYARIPYSEDPDQ